MYVAEMHIICMYIIQVWRLKNLLCRNNKMIQSLQGLYVAIITYVATIPLKLLNLHAMYEVTYSTDQFKLDTRMRVSC